MSGAARSASGAITDELLELTAVLADNKYLLGRRLSEWGVGAPNLESAVACMAIAQEELGHARGVYSLLESVPAGAARVTRDEAGDEVALAGVSFIRDETTSWYDAVASLVLLDGAMTVLLEAARASRVDELRKRALRILGDEDFHWKYATGRVRELLGNETEGGILERRIAARLGEALCWFGPADDPVVNALVREGVLDADGAAMRRAFLERLERLSAATGLRLPVRRGHDGEWEHEELPWQDWNPRDRRLRRPTLSSPAPGAGRDASSASASTVRAS